MTKEEAHIILDKQKEGYRSSIDLVKQALIITGDIDARRLLEVDNKPLCQYGPESRYIRTRSL